MGLKLGYKFGYKYRKSALCLLLCLLLCLSACGEAPQAPEVTDEPEITPIDDKYRSWYEVFIYSFYDSNGDGIGDIEGLRQKLDYVEALGANGLWLMPVMPSPSYHKYDVTDYYGIDKQYGTMEDFRALLEDAHGRGIRVIIDLVVNHTSDKHEWFLSAKQGEGSPYRDYYVWSETPLSGYSQAGDSFYESRFVSTMPDLNLDNAELRGEIEKIMRYWLCDVGVDGFRLDAVTSYYTGAPGKNMELLNWLGDTARSIKPDCYLVGEVWEDLPVIAEYAEARIDSLFTFPVAQQSGYIAKLLRDTVENPGERYANMTALIEDTLPASSIPAPFIGNHDTARAAGFLGRDPLKIKMAGGLLAMMRGSCFFYYGDELGMTGSGDDPNKRIGVLWSADEDTTKPPPGATRTEYAFPPVSEQETDEASILSYYKSALRLRAKYPEIARGASEILPCESAECCLIRRSWEGESLIIAVNPSADANELIIDAAALEIEGVADSLCAEAGECVITDGRLALPPYSIAILK